MSQRRRERASMIPNSRLLTQRPTAMQSLRLPSRKVHETYAKPEAFGSACVRHHSGSPDAGHDAPCAERVTP